MEGETLKNKWEVFQQHETFIFGVQVTSKDKRFTSYMRMVFEVDSFSLKADDGNQCDVFSKKFLSHGVDLCCIYLKTCHQIVCAVGKDCVNAFCKVY
jgi:hypothetical protein